jgi:ribose transport system ATP-binding protein
MPVLHLRGISKKFGHTIALDGVDLTLQPGEVHALIGENGAGKSTLMNVVAGSIQPDAGSMELHGKPYRPGSPIEARRGGIALIHQELSLAPHLSVAENILMGIETSRFGWLDRRELIMRSTEVLKNFNHPDLKAETKVGGLSTAAQPVVEICRAVAAQAKIILMDEPTSSLQRDDVQHLFKLIRSLTADGISIIYISHFLEEVREIANSFTVLRDGKSVANGNISDVPDKTLISHMVGREVDNLFPARVQNIPKETAIAVDELSAPPLLRNAVFQLKRGEILGIAGLIGSGRSEMVRAIFGIDSAEGGKITIRDKTTSASNAKPAQRLAEGVGYLSEDRKREGLAPAATQPAQTLSGGNQQKIAIARLIYQDAEVLLLDEPTRGIDIGSRAKIYEIIAGLAERGKAILMISSYLPELFGMCDRLAVMCRGRLSEARPIDEWTPELVLKTAIEEMGLPR